MDKSFVLLHFDADSNLQMRAVVMVTETRTFSLPLGKKIVVNSRFSRFLFGFQDAFVYIYRKAVKILMKFKQQSGYTTFLSFSLFFYLLLINSSNYSF